MRHGFRAQKDDVGIKKSMETRQIWIWQKLQRENEIELYLAHFPACTIRVLNISLFHFPGPVIVPCFLHHHCLSAYRPLSYDVKNHMK